MNRTWLWKRLTNNVGWKLASLGLAMLLWFAVVGQPELVTIQSVPLLYRNLPPHLMLLADGPDEVRVELRGPSGELTRSTLADVFVAVDLAGVTGPGTQTFTLSESDFTLPQGVTFLRAVPSQVSLQFDRYLMKSVPVQIQLKGELPPGYRLVSETVVPAVLEVSGPEARVSILSSAPTDPVSLDGLTHDTDLQVNAFVPDKRIQFESPPVVMVHLKIAKSEAIP